MNDKIIYNIAEEESYEDGQIVFKEGSSGDWVYVVLSGSVEISKSVRDQKYIIEILESGEVFGELGFIGRMKRTATAQAIGKTTVGIVDREFLEKEYNQLSGQFRSILETVTLRFRKVLDRVCQFPRRAEPRVDKVLSLVFKDRETFLQAFTGNVSAGGLFIKTEKPLSSGNQFLLKLQLPGVPDTMHIKSEVMWVRKLDASQPNRAPGMGVKFCEISKKDYQLLKEYLAGTVK